MVDSAQYSDGTIKKLWAKDDLTPKSWTLKKR
jgi:hypothetical protein